jgi:hypothetical protein
VQIGDFFDEIIRNVGGTKGQQSGVYVLTGPDFTGDVPGEMIQVKSRTKMGVGRSAHFRQRHCGRAQGGRSPKGFLPDVAFCLLALRLGLQAPGRASAIGGVRKQSARRHPLL